jgi:hypothetical protein
MSEWPFADPPNAAVIANRKIVRNGYWIAYVSHDGEDGAWQFHIQERNDLRENDAMVVALRSIVELDPAILELADLPLGWQAWRVTKNSPWVRGKMG